jgi:hypothetical protein
MSTAALQIEAPAFGRRRAGRLVRLPLAHGELNRSASLTLQ